VIETMTFTRDDSGAVTVDRFVEECLISTRLLREASPAFVSHKGNTIRFTVANGEAEYHIVERDSSRAYVRALLAKWPELPPRG
jgi:hypothetical protein